MRIRQLMAVIAVAAGFNGVGLGQERPTTVTAIVVTPGAVDDIIRSKVSRTKSDMRSMATAIETYYVDNNTYPEWTNAASKSIRKPSAGEEAVPSFASPGLTTPVAYLTTYLEDLFAKDSQTFAYYSVNEKKVNGWILFSPGPDGKVDLNYKIYDPKVEQPSPQLLARYTYDPTNGIVSRGDIWRVKQ